MEIKGLIFYKTCEACPEQYEVFKEKEHVGYVRLRFGVLRCDYPDVGGETIYVETFDDEFKGNFDSREEQLKYLWIIADKILEKISENTKVSN